MRRLAKTFRKDDYSSFKDYQEISYDGVFVYDFSNPHTNRLVYSELSKFTKGDIFSFGGYIFPKTNTYIQISLLFDDHVVHSYSQPLNVLWNRIGFCFPCSVQYQTAKVILTINCDQLYTWGITSGTIDLEHYEILDGLSDNDICSALNLPHLMPEALYLPHDSIIIMPNPSMSSSYTSRTKEDFIPLKKCSYCQRYLPIGETIASSAFHHHKAKVTGFQNECRSCKKWRINDYFNPDRSSDKLNESSIITRERKILLREPEQIIELKDRETGEGLKSQVWKRFGKKCFNCGIPLLLKEVQLDHTRPLAYLWPIDQYATCLCSTCNNNKHDSFPIDFYQSEEKLRKLSQITGLAYDKLVQKDVCEEQLQRILANIVYFANNLDARTFRSIANKVIEVRPSVDLYKILKTTNANAYNDLMTRLNERKDS